ncbi:beta-lactamase-like protein [Naematelia encephala]|uniref:Beta-lactamase-like protein n=1 Tax=Naematelia encephala TaxID=71784 RepID=A0A1Y2AKN1_9TREE|nr:beta-lactamase-like protein [Naematelia encephala]
MSSLTPVDKLEFLILVDNIVEWISVLPPGFSHELPQHLTTDAPLDNLTGLPMMDFKNYCCGAHGLSIFITTTVGDETYRVLMDGGPEGLSFERNSKSMKVPLESLDAIVLSHWHADHSGGILKALELRAAASSTRLSKIPVDLHPDRPIRRGIAPLPKRIPLVALEPDPTFEEIEAAGGRVDLHDEYHEIQVGGSKSGIGVSGEIPRRVGFEVGLPGAITWMNAGDQPGEEDGWFTDEYLPYPSSVGGFLFTSSFCVFGLVRSCSLIKDERYVVIDVKGKGLVVFSSCSHAGICNVISDAINQHGRPIYTIVGGLHLVPAHQQPVRETVDFLSRRLYPPPAYILPLHCTGLEPRAKLREAIGDRCVPAGVGQKVVVSGDEQQEERLDSIEPRILS